LEGERKDIITSRAQMVMAAFADQGKGIDAATSASITSVFLRTGMHVLTDQFTLAELDYRCLNRQAGADGCHQHDGSLSSLVWGRFKDDFIDKANALAYQKVTGEVKIQALLMNAHSIAHLHGSPYRGKLSTLSEPG